MKIQIWPFSEFSMDFGQVNKAEYSYSNSEHSKIAETFKFFDYVTKHQTIFIKTFESNGDPFFKLLWPDSSLHSWCRNEANAAENNLRCSLYVEANATKYVLLNALEENCN